jgi:LAS superfamily LD-carboxypeptidase LdcB
MFRAAQTEGMHLLVLSAYRRFNEHCEKFKKKLETRPVEEVLRTNAKPGWSEHQLGTAVDIVSKRIMAAAERTQENPLDPNQGHPEWEWLEENGYKYGFILSYPKGRQAETGYSYEPWH